MQYAVIIKSLIYYFIPLTIIAFFYVLMAIRLHHSANEMPGDIRGAQSMAQARARRHVARMVLVFVFREYFLAANFHQNFELFIFVINYPNI